MEGNGWWWWIWIRWLSWTGSGPFYINLTVLEYLVITTGVSNFPHIGWSATSMTNSDTQVESFCNILQDSFLMQMNRLVARPSSTTDNRSTGRILHLILTNHQALINNVPTRSGSYYSAHISVTFTIKSSFRRVNYGARKVYNYWKSDFDGLRTTLSCTPWEACYSAYDVNFSVESFQDL